MQSPRTDDAKLLDFESDETVVPKTKSKLTGDPLTDIFGSCSSYKQLPKIDPFVEFMNNSYSTNQESCEEVSSRPNYSRSIFESSFQSSPSHQTPKAKQIAVKDDFFGDLLEGLGFKSTKATKSLSDLLEPNKREDKKEEKREEFVQDKLLQWLNGREDNIRALLVHLDEVLWIGEDKWQKPTLLDLIDTAQIKRYYLKASVIVHPDKHTGTPNESLAHAVSSQLNIAWLAYKDKQFTNSNI